MTYGMMGMKTIVALMVRNFVLKTDYKSIEDVDLNVNIVLRPKNGYKIHLEPRKQIVLAVFIIIYNNSDICCLQCN